MAEALIGVLKLSDIQAVWAADGVQGVSTVKREKPDLVLLDLMLPRISGFEVCKILKTDNATWRIPIVIMSTLTDSESRTRAQEAGADYFICQAVALDSELVSDGGSVNRNEFVAVINVADFKEFFVVGA